MEDRIEDRQYWHCKFQIPNVISGTSVFCVYISSSGNIPASCNVNIVYFIHVAFRLNRFRI